MDDMAGTAILWPVGYSGGILERDCGSKHSSVPEQNWQSFALLLVDVQHDFWSDQLATDFPHFQQNTVELLQFCRQVGIEVIHLREVFRPDKTDWLPRYLLRGRSPCVRGTKGAEVLDFALEQPGEKVIEKQTQNGFHNPELVPYLHSKDKRFLLIAGLVTSVCVVFTATSAAQMGFLAAVVSDSCADYPEAHALALRRYKGFLLDVATTKDLPERNKEWVEQLQRLAMEEHSVAAAADSSPA
jgi:nicotinamidase-related amidase